MKTLYVIPSKGNNCSFYLCDLESGEVLASHFCSHELFAKGDLYENKPERQEKFTEKYNSEIKVKFFNEQSDMTEPEFTQLNEDWAKEQGIDTEP